MKKLYRLQVIQQMAVGVDGLTFKVDTYTLKETGEAAVEYMLTRGDIYISSGIIAESDNNDCAKIALAEFSTLMSRKGWI